MGARFAMSWYELVQQAEAAASEAAAQLAKRNELHASNRAESSIASARARKHVQALSRLLDQLRQATDSGGCASTAPALCSGGRPNQQRRAGRARARSCGARRSSKCSAAA